jgi:hypothetical protein
MTISRGLGFTRRGRRFAVRVVLAILFTSGLRAAPGPFPYARMGVANGCFVESVAFGDELRARFGEETWYRLLQWGAKEADEVVAGHAVSVFEHRGRLWSYDINHGFTPLEVPLAQREDVAAVAKLATAPYLEKITPRFPIYREDFPHAPDPSPPAPVDEGVEERDVRDAGLAAARLARHRVVSLVEFTYPKDGAAKRGAAVAFVFNGRLCVYSPAAGTFPFRVTAITVENIRQLQELLRRIHPGASNLKVR